ncbi:MAG: hypothetical protein E4G94_06425 [ANME-2 cluster archaeon]|nr:MAG: hypothetical protein E4G94_06425 [ANME-2 cluster archaeon]
MMDRDRLIEKMDELEMYLGELVEYLPDDQEEYLTNGMSKRAFQLACEDILDICNLIISEFACPSLWQGG